MLDEGMLLKIPNHILIMELFKRQKGINSPPWLIKLKYVSGIWADLQNKEYVSYHVKENGIAIENHFCSCIQQLLQNETSVRFISGCFGRSQCYNHTIDLSDIPHSIFQLNYQVYCLRNFTSLNDFTDLCGFFIMSFPIYPLLLILPCHLKMKNVGNERL